LLFHPESDTGVTVQGHRCDGYLAGSEIARLDLHRSRLVVLSACQTGIGEIQGAEGIYGLQRAFFIAGADFVIASLWKVPDVETAEFMGCFYRFFLGGAELHAAYRQTLAEMDRRYPDQPEKWAAFVLME
jgi:CHAT domain-containing protein